MVDWLNRKTPDQREDRERIGGIIEKLNALRPPLKRFRKAPSETGKLGIPQGAEYHTYRGGMSFYLTFPAGPAQEWLFELDQLNQNIKDCFAYPRFEFPVGDGWTVVWRANSDFGKVLVLLIRNAGVIAHVRRCATCGRWFYANRLNQLCCTERCRKDKYAKSPEGRARTAERMKHYMRKVRLEEKRKGKR